MRHSARLSGGKTRNWLTCELSAGTRHPRTVAESPYLGTKCTTCKQRRRRSRSKYRCTMPAGSQSATIPAVLPVRNAFAILCILFKISNKLSRDHLWSIAIFSIVAVTLLAQFPILQSCPFVLSTSLRSWLNQPNQLHLGTWRRIMSTKVTVPSKILSLLNFSKAIRKTL